MNFKRLLASLLVFVFIVGLAAPTHTSALTELEEAQARKEELRQQLAALNSQLESIKDDVKLAEEKKNTYAQRKSIVEEEIAILNQTIEIKSVELATKQAELDEKQRELDENYALFKQRLRAMYMNNDTSTLSVLLGANSFSEFLTGAETLRRISQHDTDLIETITMERDIIEAEREIIAQELASLEADQAELEQKYNELAALYVEANAALSGSQALQQATEDDYKRIIEEFAAADAEIDRLMGKPSESEEYLGTGQFAWPVPGFTWISSPFGWRTLYGQQNFHNGIDIAGSGIYGANAVAADHGKVVTTVYGSTGYGYYVIIDHGDGYKTLYGHLSAIYVTVGEYVVQGDEIGAVGSTGNSTGPHLHFEIRINGERINPVTLL